MLPRFEQFIRERQFLSNVSPSTLEWYKHSFKWLLTDSPSQDELKEAVLRMREKGLKATGCNSAIRAINTYLHWNHAGSEVKCSPACKHPRIAQLKEPQLVLPTLTEQQIKLLVRSYPQKNRSRRFLAPGAISCLFQYSQGFNSSYYIVDWRAEALDHAPDGFA